MADKVISLAERKNKAKENTETADKDKAVEMTDEDFKAIEAKNKKNAERVAKERANANKGVTRSYNLKPNDPNNKR